MIVVLVPDPLELPLTSQIGFKFGEYAEHIEKRFAGRGAGVDRLLRRLQRNTPGLELVHGPAAIARRLGIGRASVYRLLDKEAAVVKANGGGDADQT
jgi:hypothetical protein